MSISAGSSASTDDAPAKAMGMLSTRRSRLKRRRREKSGRNSTTKIKEPVPIPSFSFTPAGNDTSDDEDSKKDEIKDNSTRSMKRLKSSVFNIEDEIHDNQSISSLCEIKSQVSKCPVSRQQAMEKRSASIEMCKSGTKTLANGENSTKDNILTDATKYSSDSIEFKSILSNRGTIDAHDIREINSINDRVFTCQLLQENDPKSTATSNDVFVAMLLAESDHNAAIEKSHSAESVYNCKKSSSVPEIRVTSSRLHDETETEMTRSSPVKTRSETSKPALRHMVNTKNNRKITGTTESTCDDPKNAATTAAKRCSTLDSKLLLQRPLSLGLTKAGARALFQKKKLATNSTINVENATTELHGEIDIIDARNLGTFSAKDRLTANHFGPKDCAKNRGTKATKSCSAVTEVKQALILSGVDNNFSEGRTSKSLGDYPVLESLQGDLCVKPSKVNEEESKKTNILKTSELAQNDNSALLPPNEVAFQKSPFRESKSKDPGDSAKKEIIGCQQSCRSSDESNQLSRSGKDGSKSELIASSKYFGSGKSKKEVIEIDEDDDDEVREVVVEKQRNIVKKKPVFPVKQAQTSSTSTKTSNKFVSSVPLISRASDSSSDESAAATAKHKKLVTTKKRARRTVDCRSTRGIRKSSRSKDGVCFACSACKCHSRDGSAATPRKKASFVNLSGSDARVEQSLVNRLKQIERNLAWTQSMRHNVARDLQKHRNTMLKRWKIESSNDQLRFLPDAEVSEKWDAMLTKRSVDTKEVGRARIAAFRKNGHCSQPTLTQGFGFEGPRRSSDKGGDQEKDCRGAIEMMLNIERNDDEPESIMSDESDCERADFMENFLSCWSSQGKHREASHNLGSMDDFYDASSRCKEKRLKNLTKTVFGDTTMWANATARSIRIAKSKFSPDENTCYRGNLQDDDSARFSESSQCSDGLDTLIALFDNTIPNQKDGLLEEDEQSYCDFQQCLTPGGKKVIADIENSLIGNERKLKAVEKICPQWRENIEFVQRQKDSNEVNIALERVKVARSELNEMKENILQAFFERDSTLDIFEQSLVGAKERMDEEE